VKSNTGLDQSKPSQRCLMFMACHICVPINRVGLFTGSFKG